MLFVVASINQHGLAAGKEAPSLGPKRDYGLDQDIFEILVGDKDPDADSVDVHSCVSLNLKRHHNSRC